MLRRFFLSLVDMLKPSQLAQAVIYFFYPNPWGSTFFLHANENIFNISSVGNYYIVIGFYREALIESRPLFEGVLKEIN